MNESMPAAGRFFGSFLELELASIPPVQNSVWAEWTNTRRVTTFAAARLALRWIVTGLGCRRIWLPVYLCSEVPAALDGTACAVRYYAVDSRLEYTETAKTALQEATTGDAVLFVNYFGKPTAPDFLAFLQSLQGVTLIEDCAHSLVPAPHSPAQWRLFSPRKLLGVPDGGVAVHLGGPHPPAPDLAPSRAADVLERSAPLLLGLEDTSRSLGQYAAYRHSERLLETCTAGMMRLSRLMLQRICFQDIYQRRKDNWTVLHEMLKPYALWPDITDAERDFVPLAYPVRTANPHSVAAMLAERGIFCARHWSTLPTPRQTPSTQSFAAAHALAEELLSVPCDQRMTPQDAYFVGTTVLEQLKVSEKSITTAGAMRRK